MSEDKGHELASAPADMKQRYGRFDVSRAMLDRFDRAIFAAFAEVLVVATWRAERELITYYGYCRRFDRIAEGEKAPEYVLTIAEDPNDGVGGSVEVLWSRRDERGGLGKRRKGYKRTFN